jgi:PIN domain nuclease of toxin-antitoxin system
VSLLLDTHIVLWWLEGGHRLTPEQRRATAAAERANEKLHIADVTLWEIAMLAERGRITVPQGVASFFEELEANARLEVVPITGAIAMDAVRLSNSFPNDPADRLIAAAARVHGHTLVTADKRVRDADVVQVV